MADQAKYQRIDDVALYIDCMSLANYQKYLADSLLARTRRERLSDAGIEDIEMFNRETIDGWVYCKDFLEKRRRAANFFNGAIDVVFSYAFYKIDFRLDRVQEILTKFLTSRSYPRLLDPNKTISVRFDADTPAFVGADINVYGPFSKGNVTRIPAADASLLIKKGLAQLVSLEESEIMDKHKEFKETAEEIREAIPQERILVRFEKKMREFLGLDMKFYGPFGKGDLSRIPTLNALTLLNRNIVQLLPPEEDYSLADLIDLAKVMRIAKYMDQFERLLEVTKAGLESKFYRDHLNHMIRTYFLSLKLADIFGIARMELPSIIFASLFHDIALPLQEAYKMFTTISEALEKTYDSIKVSAFGLEFKQASRISAILAMLGEHAEKKFKANVQSAKAKKSF